jgi:Mg-chelatase subunit ChlD
MENVNGANIMSEEAATGNKPVRYICLAFDLSGTNVDQELKANIRSLLDLLFIEATKCGDKLSFINSSGRFAKQVFGFDDSKEEALAKYDEMSTGGTAPLASAIHLAVQNLKRIIGENPGSSGVLVLATDGSANVPISLGTNIRRELEIECRMLAGANEIRKVLVDTSEVGSAKADEIADLTDSVYYHSQDLNANSMYNIIKFECRESQ